MQGSDNADNKERSTFEMHVDFAKFLCSALNLFLVSFRLKNTPPSAT